MSEVGWYFVEAGKRQGPVPLASLLERLRSGELPRNALVWHPGLPQWTRAEQVSETRSALPEAAAAAPAPTPSGESLAARVEALRARLKEQPHPKLWAQLTDALREQGAVDEALQIVRNELEHFPTYGPLRLAHGRVLMARDGLEEARAELWAVLMDNPDNPLAERCLGECLERLGDTNGARTHYRAALALDRGDTVAKERLAALDSARRKPAGRAAHKAKTRPRAEAKAAAGGSSRSAEVEALEVGLDLGDETPPPDVGGSEQELELYADTSFTEKALAGGSLPRSRRTPSEAEAPLIGSFADAEEEPFAADAEAAPTAPVVAAEGSFVGIDPGADETATEAADAEPEVGEPEVGEPETAESETTGPAFGAPVASAAEPEPSTHMSAAEVAEAEVAEAEAALALAEAAEGASVHAADSTALEGLDIDGIEVEAAATSDASLPGAEAPGLLEEVQSGEPDPLLAIAIEAAGEAPAAEPEAGGFWEIEAEPPPALPEPVDVGPAEGSLADDDVPTLLQRLWRGRWSGHLVVVRAGLVKRVALENGDVVGASSSSPDDGLAERLLLTASLSLRDHADVARAVARGGSLPGVLRDKVGEERLEAAGIEVVRAIVFSLFAWTDGSFRLEADAPPDAEAVRVALRTPELVFEGVRQVFAWSRVERGAGGVTALYERTPLDDTALAELALPEAAHAVLEAHQGVKSVAMICRDAPLPDFDACQLVWALRVLGVLRPLG